MAGQSRSLNQKAALVTGATSGLGWAMADALLAAGAKVAIAARPGSRLDQAVLAWQQKGLRAEALPMDVRDWQSVSSQAAWVGSHWDRLDLVVNNAGIGMRTVNPAFLSQPLPFHLVPVERFTDLIATNLTGYFLVAKAFAPLLIAQGHGAFVNITMNHETMRRAGFVPYGPSRAATESLSLIMAEDLRPYGVDVNMLLPGGATRTGMIPEDLDPSRLASLIDPAVMGPPIVFLAGDGARGISGQRIVATDWAAWLVSWQAGPAGPGN